MTHWLIAPVILPAILAPIMALAMRHDMNLMRVFSVAGSVALTVIAAGLLMLASGGETMVYELGDWQGPFGIVLVLDRLSALMVLITAVLSVIVVLYAIGSGWDKRGWHFHPLFQFQLMGIIGAFLTGDLFNLFVFFEILLIASYGLMIHSGGSLRMRAGVQYVVMNLAGSTLFLFALGTLYAVTGTLNMADMAVRVDALAPDEASLIRVAAMLLLIVFAVKAALVPIHFWLPGTYANAPAPVAALFAIMTKVGAYAILRVYTLVFDAETAATGTMAADWLMPAALVTLVIGVLGMLGSRQLARMIAFSVLGSMGTLMVAIALFTPESVVAALYYLIHSTFAAAALFLIADLVISRRGEEGGALIVTPPMAQSGLIAGLFFAGAIAMAGMPPLAGFFGKLMVLDVARSDPDAALIWGTILVTSLIMILSFARAGSTLFWAPAAHEPVPPILGAEPPSPPPAAALPIVACVAPLALLALLVVAAGPVTVFLADTALQIHDTDQYINAVLGSTPGEEAAQ